MFSKVDVNGANAHPLFKYLKSRISGSLGSFIKWNFEKVMGMCGVVRSYRVRMCGDGDVIAIQSLFLHFCSLCAMLKGSL